MVQPSPAATLTASWLRSSISFGEETRDFYRLYMLPGMFHCRSGYGPDTLDAMTPLIEWVETGKAPEALETRQMEGETVVRSRPACPYPQVAVHDGSGDPDDAASFSCEAPASQ